METYTFLFTDIEGSTRLLRRLGQDGYGRVLADHHTLIRSVLAARHGKELDAKGDGFFAVFSSPSTCVTAVVEMQQCLDAHPWPAGEHVRVRMGVHTGEAERTATGVVGLDVHRAARVAAVAYGGQVLLSETAAALVRDSLPPGSALTDLGVHRLKDLGRPEQIFQLRAAGLQAEFPPLRSLSNPALRNNLPAQLAPFIGRDRELSAIRALVVSSRLVTLIGAGGSGKTRLSLQVAADLLDRPGDGVWVVELAAVSDEDGVVPAIFEVLGVAGERGRPLLDTLLDALAPQEMLILLDNCEHLTGTCAKVADAILRRCPRVDLVATSREPLGVGGETVYRVPPLSLPLSGDNDISADVPSDAVALFVERAREHGAGISRDEQTSLLIASICVRLDGIPLAIELAAARSRSLSLSELHDRLDQRFRLLTGGSRTALARQQTLRATVEWSYALLTGAEQLLLERLSVFAESFDLDAAEAVCGSGDIETYDVVNVLGSLVDKNLVVAEPGGGGLRYRLLETIRQFAADRLAEAGQDDAAIVEAAYGRHFLAVAEGAAPHLTGHDQDRWFARLDSVQANLRRAIELAARNPDGTEQVLRFGVALRHYWIARSRDDEAARLLLPVLDRAGDGEHPELLGAALVTVAIFLHSVDVKAALRVAEQAVEIARRLGDVKMLIEALAVLGSSYYFAGDPARGFPFGQEAVERARQLDDDVLLGFTLLCWLLCSDVIDPARYGPLFTEAIACTDRSGDKVRNYRLHNNAGVHALRTGNVPAARVHLEQAGRAMQAIGAKNDHHLPVNLGWVLRQENDPDGSRSMFQTSLRISRRVGNRAGIAYACLGLACLAADCSEWHLAAELHGAAQAALDRTGQPWQEPEGRYRGDSLDEVRARLGNEDVDRDLAKGMALSTDEALDLALRGAQGANPSGR